MCVSRMIFEVPYVFQVLGNSPAPPLPDKTLVTAVVQSSSNTILIGVINSYWPLATRPRTMLKLLTSKCTATVVRLTSNVLGRTFGW